MADQATSVESAVTSNTSYTGFLRHLLSLHKTIPSATPSTWQTATH